MMVDVLVFHNLLTVEVCPIATLTKCSTPVKSTGNFEGLERCIYSTAK